MLPYGTTVNMDAKFSKLSDQQRDLVDKVVNKRKNIFFTGCAGTGKSFVLSYIVSELRRKYKSHESVAVTASTGKAAFNISGCTLHSFAGIGLGKGTKDELARKVFFNNNSKERWLSVKTIIIDEISMISAALFEKLEFIARYITKSQSSFGGIQIILVGDFLQLPPVFDDHSDNRKIFQSDTWKLCIDECVLLTKVFRQEDMGFVRFLTCIRLGSVNEEVLNFVTELEKEKDFGSESGPVELFATRNKAMEFNLSELEKIQSRTYTFQSKDRYSKNVNPSLFDSCPAQKELLLKIGAQVMVVKNLNKNVVNGTVGVITRFIDPLNPDLDTSSPEFGSLENTDRELVPVVRFTLADGRMFTKYIKRETWEIVLPNGNTMASRNQIPLILSWAMTIHKSQGQTIQRLKVDLSNIFESGQLYTALSRVVSHKSLEVIGFDPLKVKVDPDAVRFYVENELI